MRVSVCEREKESERESDRDGDDDVERESKRGEREAGCKSEPTTAHREGKLVGGAKREMSVMSCGVVTRRSRKRASERAQWIRIWAPSCQPTSVDRDGM